MHQLLKNLALYKTIITDVATAGGGGGRVHHRLWEPGILQAFQHSECKTLPFLFKIA